MQQKPYSIAYPHSPSTKAIIELSNMLCKDSHIEHHKNKGIAQLFSYIYHSKFRK